MIAKRQSGVLCRIDVSAFVAVILAVLFAFMGAIASYRDLPTHSVDLVHATNMIKMRGALREDAIQVTITRDGSFFLGPDRVAINELAAKIQAAIKSGSERKVYIRADRLTYYRNVAQVLDEVHRAGVEKVSFMTEIPR